MLEACAGMLDGDDPEACARREASEETGVRIAAARHAFDAFTSPGALTEKIGCFVAPYSARDRVGAGGGVDADEHIEVVEVGYEEAEAMIASGAIRDAKTIALHLLREGDRPVRLERLSPAAGRAAGREWRRRAGQARRRRADRCRGGTARSRPASPRR